MDMPMDYHAWGATHTKVDPYPAELNDRFVDHIEWFVSRVY